jgi:hypothetical protein
MSHSQEPKKTGVNLTLGQGSMLLCWQAHARRASCGPPGWLLGHGTEGRSPFSLAPRWSRLAANVLFDLFEACGLGQDHQPVARLDPFLRGRIKDHGVRRAFDRHHNDTKPLAQPGISEHRPRTGGLRRHAQFFEPDFYALGVGGQVDDIHDRRPQGRLGHAVAPDGIGGHDLIGPGVPQDADTVLGLGADDDLGGGG